MLLLLLLLLLLFWLPPPVPALAFSELAFAVKSVRICCICVFGLATTGGVGQLRSVIAARIACIFFVGLLATAANGAVVD